MNTNGFPQSFSSVSGRLVDVIHSAQQLVIEDTSGDVHYIAPSRDPATISTWFSPSESLIGRRVAIVSLTGTGADLPLAEPWLVLEPDHVVDVTEAAQLVGSGGVSVVNVLVKRLRPPGSMSLALTGTLVNTAFDILVRQPGLTDKEIIHESLATRTLSLAAAWHDGSLAQITSAITQAMPALHSALDLFSAGDMVLEPHYISPTFGLQGRADIIIRTNSEIHVVEMKAGRAAPGSTVRPDHASQVAAYATLIKATEPLTSVDATIWYVQDATQPMRKLNSYLRWMAPLLIARNAIIASDLALARRSGAPLRRLRSKDVHSASSYDEQAQSVLAETYSRLDRTESLVARAWLGFAATEHGLVRVGGGTSRSTADLWRKDLTEKQNSTTVVTDLLLDEEKSDHTRMHLVFVAQSAIGECALRVGDPVILHPEKNGQSLPCDGPLFKATLRGLNQTRVDVSLRNKHVNINDVVGKRWIMEQDVLDTNVRSLYSAIRTFIDATADKRNLLLGRRSPLHDSASHVVAPDLTEEQRAIVERALASKELFLIQGPPGTGKTSAVLRTIVANLVDKTNERVLAIAYTNRAANEISASLTRYGIAHIRHGSSDGVHENVSIATLGQNLTSEQLADRISSASCVVSTVQSLYSSPEIWDFGTFSTSVVDEASQILEPHMVGIMARVGRSILIGDHCQLPAVVTQRLESLTVDGPEFTSIEMQSLSMSAFERLVRCAHSRGDEGCMAMLTQQGRMHDDIMRFVSDQFYDHKLVSLAPWQRNAEPLPWADIIPYRSVVLPLIADADQAGLEAGFVVKLALKIHARSTEYGSNITIGIITPFRVQNNAILNALPDDLRGIVTVDTVERFQGSERDVIIYATAVSSTSELESISSEIDFEGRCIDRKFNVAITRARQQFILVGNTEILKHARAYAAAIDVLQTLPIKEVISRLTL